MPRPSTCAVRLFSCGFAVLSLGASAVQATAPVPGPSAALASASAPNAAAKPVRVDTERMRSLAVGDELPADVAGVCGRGQRLLERRPLDGNAVYLRFAHPRFGAAWSEMIVREGRIAACVRNGIGGVESTRTHDDGSMHRVRLDEAARAECAGTRVPPADGPGGDDGIEANPPAHLGGCDPATSFDVLVYVTVPAVTSLGGLQATIDEVKLGIESANTCYANGFLALRARLVGVRICTAATFDGDGFDTDLDRLRANDGWLDEALSARTEWGADIVSLWRTQDPTTGFTGAAGLGYLLLQGMSNPASAGFNVVRADAAVSNLSFAHEIGHNMGCCHASGDTSNCNAGAYYETSLGHRWTGDSGARYRSVMAYNPPSPSPSHQRVPYFSTPIVSLDGQPVGSATAKNRETIFDTATIFSTFACSTVPDNDDCRGAPTLADGVSQTATNNHATNYFTEGLGCGGDFTDVWYRIAPTVNGQAVLRLCPSFATTQTTLAVYNGYCGGTQVACSSEALPGDPCPSAFASGVVFPVSAGNVYYVRASCLGSSATVYFNGQIRVDYEASSTCSAGNCFAVHAQPGCSDDACCALVCSLDAFCCGTRWDALCAESAAAICARCGDTANGCYAVASTPGCSDGACCSLVTAADDFCGLTSWDALCARAAMELCAGCGDPAGGACASPHPWTGCADGACCISVCTADAYCCETVWDSLCVQQATALCTVTGDLSGDGRVDANDLAILLNAWGLAGGDLNGDGITNGSDLALMLNAWTG